MKLLSIFVFLSPLITLTVIIMLIYGAVQQNFRTSANDPQVQMAYDIRDRLSEGRSIEHLIPGDSIAIDRSLGVFVAFYDRKGMPVRATGYLHGKMPELPAGVFESTATSADDRVTWQPERNVRMAMVIVRVKSPDYAYVAVGRSLNEVESRVGRLGRMAFMGWLAGAFILLIRGIIQYKRN